MRPARHVFRALNFGLFRHLQGVVDLDRQEAVSEASREKSRHSGAESSLQRHN
jgi:hypothetical protein